MFQVTSKKSFYSVFILFFYVIIFAQIELYAQKNHYYIDGKNYVKKQIKQKPNTKRAKNIILFIGDGNGLSSVYATRVFEGQKLNKMGEEHQLSYEKFPYLALSKTYTTNMQVPDSAGTATAILTGIKTRSGVLGVNDRVKLGDCQAVEANKQLSIAYKFFKKDLAVGLVTTTTVTHATPAALYAHSANRSYESSIPKTCLGQKDIASQLINSNLDLVLGGGKKHFLPQNMSSETKQFGARLDKRDLIQQWQNQGGEFASTATDLKSMSKSKAKILGLFSNSHLPYEADRKYSPSLSELTAFAIKHLKRKSPKGFFLLVEGGRIDHANHQNNAFRMVRDGVEFAKAVDVADQLTNDSDTLLIVSADHSHVLSAGGYSKRGSNILGLCYQDDLNNKAEQAIPCKAKDNKAYTILSYANGSSSYFSENNKNRKPIVRDTLTQEKVLQADYKQEALIPLAAETHGAEDVAIYAKGPWAHLFQGTIEQHIIYHVMNHAINP